MPCPAAMSIVAIIVKVKVFPHPVIRLRAVPLPWSHYHYVFEVPHKNQRMMPCFPLRALGPLLVAAQNLDVVA